MKFITKCIVFVLFITSSLIHSMDKPLHEKALDYASRYKKQLGMGIGAAAALGSLYYGYQHGWFSGQQSGINIINSSNWKFEHQEDREFPVGNKSLVEIVNTAGDIDVQTYAGNTIKVHIHKRAETQADLDNIYADIHENNQRLLITTRQRAQLVKALINYKLLLPQDKKIALIAKTNAGNINVLGIRNDVNAESSNGNLIIKNSNGSVVGTSRNGDITFTRITGDLNAKTSNGDVRIDDIGGNVTAESSRGNIQVSKVNGLLKASTNSGVITAEQVKNAQIKSYQGDIFVRANQGTFSGSTNAGNVTLDQDVIDQPVNISSNMGDIKVYAKHINGPIKPRTSMGKVRSGFQLNRQGPGVVTLQTSMGDITVIQK